MRRSTSALAAAAAVTATAVAWAARDVPAALGARPSGRRLERLRRSPRYRDGAFRNPVPASTLPPGSGRRTVADLMANRGTRAPSAMIPVLAPPGPDAPAPPEGSLFITWYGHSSSLVEIDGRRILLDPVWSQRCSPSALVGPRRLHPVPVALADLPPLDAVVISHDHYDHLDMPTVVALNRLSEAPFVVPLGAGAHLERWGVPEHRIVELDWDEHVEVAGVRLTAAAARHFSGRGSRRDGTLWASWVLAGPTRSVFYSGDTGWFDGYPAIGAEHGPFDATLIQIGAYGPAWPDIHLTPEDGVSVHVEVGGGVLVPVHWATFNLAVHPWAEPADRVWAEAKARGVTLAVPRPGQRFSVDEPPAVDGWWQTVA